MNLEVRYTHAVRAASAMLATIGKTKVEILRNAYFDGQALLASDKYRAVRYDLPAAPEQPDDRLVLGDELLIPEALLAWVTRVKPDRAKLRQNLARMSDSGYTIRFTQTGATVTAELVDLFGAVEASADAPEPDGNFPPLAKLFGIPHTPATPNAPQAFNPDLLASIFVWAGKYGGGEPTTINLTEKRDKTEHLIADVATVTCGAATFLVHPMQAR